MTLKLGDINTFERTFKLEDVVLFTKISGDEGTHHTTVDELGRHVIQGLLTATLPTKIGGVNNILARIMHFEFLRPVFTGDKIICEVTIDKHEEQDNNRIAIEASFQCVNQYVKQVLKGNFTGVII